MYNLAEVNREASLGESRRAIDAAIKEVLDAMTKGGVIPTYTDMIRKPMDGRRLEVGVILKVLGDELQKFASALATGKEPTPTNGIVENGYLIARAGNHLPITSSLSTPAARFGAAQVFATEDAARTHRNRERNNRDLLVRLVQVKFLD